MDAGGETWAAKRAIEAHLAACAAALFCESSAGGRGGFARGAGTARPQRCEHDADLYACGSGEAQGDSREVSSAALVNAPARSSVMVECHTPTAASPRRRGSTLRARDKSHIFQCGKGRHIFHCAERM